MHKVSHSFFRSYSTNNSAVSSPWSRLETTSFFLVLLLALTLRLYLVLVVPNPGPFSDGQNYDLMARQLVSKHIYAYNSNTSNAYVTPGFPVFLAAVYKVHGMYPASPIDTVRFYQSLMMTAVVGIIYLLGRRAAGPGVAFVAALIAAIYPPFIWSTSAILTESLFTFLLMAFIYTIILTLEKQSAPICIISGLFFGAAVLTKPQLAPFFFIPFLLFYIYKKKRAK